MKSPEREKKEKKPETAEEYLKRIHANVVCS
jgi:hypothetical protein